MTDIIIFVGIILLLVLTTAFAWIGFLALVGVNIITILLGSIITIIMFLTGVVAYDTILD